MPRQIALFISCLNDQFLPRVGVAVTRVLEHLGCSVVFPQAQTCCGQSMFNCGFPDEARRLARRWIETFEPYEYVVTPSGSCCAMVRTRYPELFRGDPAWEADARAVAGKTFDFVEFLVRVLKVDLGGLSLPRRTRVTFHYTCQLRALGITDEPVRLLRQIGNLEVVPLEQADECCGFGGGLALSYPGISRAMVQNKVRRLGETGAEWAVCNDAGCAINIAGMCQRESASIRVLHQAEVLAEALGLDTRSL